MNRLTERKENGVINVRYATEHETAIHRLAAIEDILGDDYELGPEALAARLDVGCPWCDDPCFPRLDWEAGLDHILPDYQYCPMCGRPMTHEALERLAARLRGEPCGDN